MKTTNTTLHIDNLRIVAKEPNNFFEHLEKITGYKLKVTGIISYHLGYDCFRDKYNILCYAPRKYIKKLILDHMKMFGHKPKQYWSLLENGDHPKTYTKTNRASNDINL